MVDITGAVLVPYNQYLAAKSASTSGIALIASLDGGGQVVAGSRIMFSVMDFGAVGDNTADDAPKIQAAIDAAAANGGGIVFFPMPANRYKCNSTLTVEDDGVQLIGESRQVILNFLQATSGCGIALGGVYHWVIQGLTILSSYTCGIEINGGTVAGPHDYCAYGKMKDVYVRGARNTRDNIEIYECIVSSFEDVLSQEGTRHGIAVYGFATTLRFSGCYAFSAAGDGVHFENLMTFTWENGGADYNLGYAFYCEDCIGVFDAPYAEGNYYSAFRFFYDSATTALTPGVRVEIRDPAVFQNNWNTGGGGSVRNAGVGHFATCGVTGSGSASNVTAGTIKVTNFKEQNSGLTGKHIEGAGAFRWSCDSESLMRLTWATSIGFMVAGDGSTDYLYALPVNVSGANTRIATLGPKLRNGVAAFGGVITVSASSNNRSSASKHAVYELIVSRGTGFSELKLIESAGHDGGAASDEPSFTFDFDDGTNTLRATVVGSTATGSYYFHIACKGNVSAIPG